MSAPLCTSEQAIAALGYLRNSFGGYGIPEPEGRPYLRLFRNFTAQEVQDAIDALTRIADRRPSPNEIAQQIRARRPSRRADGPYLCDIPTSDLTMPAEFSDRVSELRSRLDPSKSPKALTA